MFVYIMLLLKQLILFEKDDTKTTTEIVDINKTPELKFDEIVYQPIFQLQDKRFVGPKANLKYDDDLKRFITVKVTQHFENFMTNQFSKVDIGIRECMETDFRTEYQKSLYIGLKAAGYYNYCPKNTEKIRLKANKR